VLSPLWIGNWAVFIFVIMWRLIFGIISRGSTTAKCFETKQSRVRFYDCQKKFRIVSLVAILALEIGLAAHIATNYCAFWYPPEDIELDKETLDK